MQKISLKSIDGHPTGKPIKPSNTKFNQQLHNNYLFAEVAVHQFGHKIVKYSMNNYLARWYTYLPAYLRSNTDQQKVCSA